MIAIISYNPPLMAIKENKLNIEQGKRYRTMGKEKFFHA